MRGVASAIWFPALVLAPPLLAASLPKPRWSQVRLLSLLSLLSLTLNLLLLPYWLTFDGRAEEATVGCALLYAGAFLFGLGGWVVWW